MIETKEKVYSVDEEYYYDDIEYIKERVEDANLALVYIADKKEYEHSDFLSIDTLIEDMQENANEQGEWAEGYLNNVSKEDKQLLENLIADIFKNKIPKPHFFAVKNVEAISRNEFLNKIYFNNNTDAK